MLVQMNVAPPCLCAPRLLTPAHTPKVRGGSVDMVVGIMVVVVVYCVMGIVMGGATMGV
jgi:hypothetical protein